MEEASQDIKDLRKKLRQEEGKSRMLAEEKRYTKRVRVVFYFHI